MTSIDDGPRFSDFLGVPTYYVTDVVREDAGDGNVRIWNCTMRGGIMFPHCELIVPAHRLLTLSQATITFAADVCQHQLFLHTGMHH